MTENTGNSADVGVVADARNVLDRLQIEELIHAYAQAVDLRRWDLFDVIFDADAVIDASGVGLSASQSPACFMERVEAGRGPNWTVVQHCMTNIAVEVHGDTANSFTDCYDAKLYPITDRPGSGTERTVCIFYRDAWIRKNDSWRLRRREIYLRGKFTREVQVTALDTFSASRAATARLTEVQDLSQERAISVSDPE
jgi:hypothetical protein